MNLYIIVDSSRAAIYGIGSYIRELTAVLRKSNINVCIVDINSDKPQIQKEEIKGIRYWYFPEMIKEQRTIDHKKQIERYYQNIVYLLQLYIEDKKNLIFHLNYNKYHEFAKALKREFDCRIVATVHYFEWGLTIYDNLHRLRTIIDEKLSEHINEFVKKSFDNEKLFFLIVDHVVCLSKYMYEILYHDYKLDVSKLSVISNGMSDLKDSKTNLNYLRKKWHVPFNEKVILFVGRMDEIKGLTYLIKAFRTILTFFPQSRLVIAGDGDYKTYTRDAQDICTKITYTGFLNMYQLSDWYQLADVGVIPSLFESFGLVAVEMMMHELPVVATATSGLNEVIDETSGIKIPIVECPEKVAIDTDLLAEKILYLLQYPEEAKRMGINGRNRYLLNYTSEIFRNKMLDFYHSIFFPKT